MKRPRSQRQTSPAPRVMAIAAHPDDIEFVMAGTMLLLAKAGWELHYLNLSSGNCGSMTMGPAETRAVRRAEAQAAAKKLGALWHAGFCDDLEITYDVKLLRRLGAVVREVNPSILLTHSPEDYMEDHINTARLAVTAAFSKGFPNFRTLPPTDPAPGPVTLYHAMPHGLVDPLRRPVAAHLWVDTGSVQGDKRAALAEHRSQKEWLDKTQGMDSYLQAMDDFARQAGRQSGRFNFAEGWRRRLHYGFCGPGDDPLRQALGRLALADPLANRPL